MPPTPAATPAPRSGATHACLSLGALGAVLLLGLLLLLELPPVTGTGADKPGVCPQLSADLNCTQDCRADQDCAENLKCCRAGCSAICSIPNAPAIASLRNGEETAVSAWPRVWLQPSTPPPLSGLCIPPGLTTASPLSDE
uniref:WAP four-disulfide core domain protein 2 n=1 Tax=Oryctolagus cuniculus TaxID=9986 RepID=A0A5F9DAP8_RABIT